MDQQRVDFERLQVVAQRQREVAHAGDDGGQRVEVGGVGAAGAVEHGRAAQGAQHPACLRRGYRQGGESGVLQHLDQHAAERHRQHRAPVRVAHDADQQLGAAAAHRADQHALDACAAAVRLRGGGDGAVGLFDGVGVRRDVQPDAADLGLVQDLRGDDLEAERGGDGAGDRGRFVLGGDEAGGDDRDAGGGQQLPGGVLGP